LLQGRPGNIVTDQQGKRNLGLKREMEKTGYFSSPLVSGAKLKLQTSIKPKEFLQKRTVDNFIPSFMPASCKSVGTLNFYRGFFIN
jgi:hypothetical protein